MGDLNVDLLSPGVDAGIVRDLASEFSLKLLNYGPTYHIGTSHTFINVICLIGVICVDDNDVVVDHRKVK